MFRVLGYIAGVVSCFVALLLCVACGDDAEEYFPNGDPVALNLKLGFEPGISLPDDAQVRYIVRAYPARQSNKNKKFVNEFVFTRSVAGGLDFQADVQLNGGDYELLVWADFVADADDIPFYDAEDFGEIVLVGDHCGSNELRAAFNGSATVSLADGVVADTLTVDMQRTLARFELRADDFADFVSSELARLDESVAAGDSVVPFNLENYTVVCYYIGFMPCAYSLYTNKPVDSATGVKFFSSVKPVNDTQALLLDDFVFVNDKSSMVSVRVGVFDANNELVSLTGTIKVPLNRGGKTTVNGNFLTQKKTDGIVIDTGYDGNFNLIFK